MQRQSIQADLVCMGRCGLGPCMGSDERTGAWMWEAVDPEDGGGKEYMYYAIKHGCTVRGDKLKNSIIYNTDNHNYKCSNNLYI